MSKLDVGIGSNRDTTLDLDELIKDVDAYYAALNRLTQTNPQWCSDVGYAAVGMCEHIDAVLLALRRIPALEAAIERLTGISTNGDMPRYLDARERMAVAEARIEAVEKLCAAKDRIDTSSCQPGGGGWATTDEIRAALAEPS